MSETIAAAGLFTESIKTLTGKTSSVATGSAGKAGYPTACFGRDPDSENSDREPDSDVRERDPANGKSEPT